jgi:hypothetical protein
MAAQRLKQLLESSPKVPRTKPTAACGLGPSFAPNSKGLASIGILCHVLICCRTLRARIHVRNFTPFESLARETGNKVARARVSRTRESSGFTTPASRAVGAVQSALGVGGYSREIFVLATCPLQYAKAGSAATLPQQEKTNTVHVQRGRVNSTGFM